MASPSEQITRNGASVFRVLVAVLAILVPFVVSLEVWQTRQLNALQRMTDDRLTGTMFIEIQQELEQRNTDHEWLKASDIRAIQGNHPPYRAPQ